MNKNSVLFKTFLLDGFMAIGSFATSFGLVSVVIQASRSTITSETTNASSKADFSAGTNGSIGSAKLLLSDTQFSSAGASHSPVVIADPSIGRLASMEMSQVESYCVNPMGSSSMGSSSMGSSSMDSSSMDSSNMDSSNMDSSNSGERALIRVNISPESRVKASVVESEPRLVHQQWTECVIAIENGAGVKSHLQLHSDQFVKEGPERADRWLRAEWVSTERLTGEAIEYRTVRFWSRDAGKRAAVIEFNVGQGTQDLGFRSDVLLVFDVLTP